MPQNIQDIILGGAGGGGGSGAGIKGDWDVTSTLTNIAAVFDEYGYNGATGVYNPLTKILTSPATSGTSNVVDGAVVTFAKSIPVSVDMHQPLVFAFEHALTNSASAFILAGFADAAMTAAQIQQVIDFAFRQMQALPQVTSLPASFNFIGYITTNTMDSSVSVVTLTRDINDYTAVSFNTATVCQIADLDAGDLLSFMYRKVNTSDDAFAQSGASTISEQVVRLISFGLFSKNSNVSFESIAMPDAMAVGQTIDGAYVPTALRPFAAVLSVGSHLGSTFSGKIAPDKVLGKVFIPTAMSVPTQLFADIVMPPPYIHAGDLITPVFPSGTLVNDMYRAIGGGVAYNVYATEGDILLVDNVDSGTESVRIAIPIDQTAPAVTVDSTGVTNVSNVSGQTVTDALNTLGSDVQTANSNASNASSQVSNVISELAYFKQAQDIYTIQGMTSGNTFGRYIISTMTSPGATIQYYAPIGCVIEIFNTTGSPYTLIMNTGNTGQTLVGGSSYNIPANSYVRLIMDASNNWVAL